MVTPRQYSQAVTVATGNVAVELEGIREDRTGLHRATVFLLPYSRVQRAL